MLTTNVFDLQKSNTIKDQLFSVIGHDLTGYIGTMPAVLELCRDEKTTSATKDFLLSQLEKNAVASFETLQNLLKWGTAQIQGISLKQVDFNPHAVTEEVLPLVNVSAEPKQITIVNNIPTNTIAHADLNHFRFIIRNLLSNAIKYTRNGGHIEVYSKSSIEDNRMIFAVKDEGVGISDNKKAEIFDSFGISTLGTANEKGTGIGLRLCKEFVVENGGAIWVESVANKGTSFFFSLKQHQ